MKSIYDAPDAPVVASAQPQWYRNLPGQMVGRSIIMGPPRRPGAVGPFDDPGVNPSLSGSELLLSWQGDTDAPIPVTLSIRVEPVQDLQQEIFFPPSTANMFAGQGIRSVVGPLVPYTMESKNTGYIELTYGVGGDQKRAYFDLADGTYDLPPVSWVRVSAQRYAGGFTLLIAPPVGPHPIERLPDDLGDQVAVGIEDPVLVGASLHAGSHAGDYVPVFSSFFNQFPADATGTYFAFVPPRAREFIYGLTNPDPALCNVTVSGAVQTKSRILTGPTPGSFNQPFWGPGLPVIPRADFTNGQPYVEIQIDNVGGNVQTFYAGFRLAL